MYVAQVTGLTVEEWFARPIDGEIKKKSFSFFFFFFLFRLKLIIKKKKLSLGIFDGSSFIS